MEAPFEASNVSWFNSGRGLKSGFRINLKIRQYKRVITKVESPTIPDVLNDRAL